MALVQLLAAESPYPLSNTRLSELAERLQITVDSLADVFSLKLPQGLEYRDVLARAHAQLASVAEDVARDMIVPGSRPRSQPDRDWSLTEQISDLTAAMAAVTESQDFAAPAALAAPARPTQPSRPAKPVLATAVKAAPVETAKRAIDTDPHLVNWLATSVAACRHGRLPLTLVLLELDGYELFSRRQGAEAAEVAVTRLGEACRSLDAPSMVCLQVRDARFAVVLSGWDREQGMNFARQLMPAVRKILLPQADGELAPMSVSIGLSTVSLPPKNFPADSLLESATRCLLAARRAGGNSIKSIGIY